ncbi:clasp N-terminal domain-containing protein, partial [Thamnocephalis sphaerospora]
IATERTQLSGTAVELVETLARVLRKDFTQVMDFLVPAVVRLCGRTNKVFVKRATRCLENSVHYTQLPEFISHFAEALRAQSKVMRKSAAECVCAVLRKLSVDELTAHVAQLETMIRTGLVDADAEVRAESRKAYEMYTKLFESRVPA